MRIKSEIYLTKNLLTCWCGGGEVYAEELKVPSCDEGCEDCESGCAAECPIEKREKNVREWLQEQEE